MSVLDQIGPVKTAFVFAGGGSFGAIQVGMLHSLAAHGIVADMVVGSSVGALNGAFYAGDPTLGGVERLATVWRGLTRQDVFPINWRTVLGFIRRRDFLALGSLALGGLTLTDVLRARAATGARPKSAIMIFLSGGPSHLDTYDMKPHLSDDYRGEFKPIATKVPGLQSCERMPRQAKIADKLAVRGVKTVGNHTGNEFFSGFTFEQSRGHRDAAAAAGPWSAGFAPAAPRCLCQPAR